jgi:hypothetical protein
MQLYIPQFVHDMIEAALAWQRCAQPTSRYQTNYDRFMKLSGPP